MDKKLFIANWKMTLTDAAAETLAHEYVKASKKAACDLAVAPSFTALERVGKVLGKSEVALGAQDVFWAESGAYTGEISAPMLFALGVRYVLVGHSERRANLGETDEMIGKKASAASRGGLVPVICVGETAEEKETGKREEVIRRQVAAALKDFSISSETPVIIAYEPRWAIGTGIPCSPAEAVVVHELIKSIVPAKVLYGGSVDAANIKHYVSEAAIDGVLVGGASTKADQIGPLLASFA